MTSDDMAQRFIWANSITHIFSLDYEINITAYPSIFKFDDVYGCIGNVNISNLLNISLDKNGILILDNIPHLELDNNDFSNFMTDFIDNGNRRLNTQTKELMNYKKATIQELKGYTHQRELKKELLEEFEYTPNCVERIIEEKGFEEAMKIFKH
jgi:hypothetical protein